MKYLPLVLLIALFSACGSGSGEQATSSEPATSGEAEATSDAAASEETAEREVSIVFPSAVEIMTVFKNAGLKYESGTTHDRSRADQYNTKFRRAIGIGMYTADLAYCVVNGQNQEALAYLSTVLSTSRQVGIPAVDDPEALVDRFSNALGNEEEVLQILTEVQQESDYFIDENEMEDMATVIFSGAWVEGMYLAVEANREFDIETLSSRVIEQMDILDNLLRALNQTDMDDPEYTSYVERLNELNNYFQGLDAVKNAASPAQAELGLGELKEISDKIVELRNEMA